MYRWMRLKWLSPSLLKTATVRIPLPIPLPTYAFYVHAPIGGGPGDGRIGHVYLRSTTLKCDIQVEGLCPGYTNGDSTTGGL